MAHPSSSGGDAGSAETWRMAHLPSGDEDDGSKQQVWTKTLKALARSLEEAHGKGLHDSSGQPEGVEGLGLSEENG